MGILDVVRISGEGGINLIALGIGLALIVWGLYRERDFIKELLGLG
jgi:hypothetical protein